jgi:hypothetical protein
MLKFCQNLKEMVDTGIEEIIWCYGIAQASHRELHRIMPVPVRLFEGLPELDEISSLESGPKLVIIEDLQSETDDNMELYYTRGSHHRNLSLIRSLQNLYHRGKGNRDITLNSHYLVLFFNPRDRSQISHFARQVDPQNSKFIIEAYRDATTKPHTYLLFDFTQAIDNDLRFRAAIFPGEENIIYVGKRKK